MAGRHFHLDEDSEGNVVGPCCKKGRYYDRPTRSRTEKIPAAAVHDIHAASTVSL